MSADPGLFAEPGGEWPRVPPSGFGRIDPATSRRLRDLNDVDADPSADADWGRFLAVLRTAQAEFGRINPNQIRERLRGQVPPRRISGFYHRAKRRHLLVGPVRVTRSTDLASRNRGKPIRIYRFQESAA